MRPAGTFSDIQLSNSREEKQDSSQNKKSAGKSTKEN